MKYKREMYVTYVKPKKMFGNAVTRFKNVSYKRFFTVVLDWHMISDNLEKSELFSDCAATSFLFNARAEKLFSCLYLLLSSLFVRICYVT